MTYKYNIKPKPQVYAGTHFRSRLEATWAAFFDLLGWKWEYEPFDLKYWSPDFIITNPNKGNGDLLVEVKPYILSCELHDLDKHITDIKQKIIKSHDGESLLLGVSPFYSDDYFSGSYSLGHLIHGEVEEDIGNIKTLCVQHEDLAMLNHLPEDGYDICGIIGSYQMRLSKLYDGDAYLHPVEYHSGEKLWGLAKKKTRYEV